ncbi:polysaccharide deacetylase family protein [Roseospira visakhapatnamensis]|uniref:Polysaccharide deacetylase n=1 Tax=Roseospira visakhapatnamensis TaxID=390880 RepID=A0A7W6RE22_9PROT|nr:polysaccharide deacetylase family protein [Roseospira visakhapatnamensis]MBB4266341.1 hypothetical protein [Roseospira visakhapatnamensis]
MMAPWDVLETELAAWHRSGRRVTLWWRDDDAVAVTPALEHLAALSGTHAAPVTLAVIPAFAKPELASFVATRPMLSVAQHGHTHHNHALPGAPASEFPTARSMEDRLADLGAGWHRLTAVFGDHRPVPMLVAPYNKVGDDLPEALPTVGLSALSVHGPREQWGPAWGTAPVAVVNTHVDLLRWRPDAQFIGAHKTIHRLVAALQARRLGRDTNDLPRDPDEPLGLLTHHLVHTDDLWAFLAELLPRLTHPAVRWCDVRTLIQEAGAP